MPNLMKPSEIVAWLLVVLKDTCLRMPRRFRLERVECYLDGGTTILVGRDEHGHQRRIRLSQQTFVPMSWFDWSTGRLYVGWRRVPMRSSAETAILKLTERLVVEQEAAGPAEGELPALYRCRIYSLWMMLNYVQSDSYGKASDTDERWE
jgi:hypothetical protein